MFGIKQIAPLFFAAFDRPHYQKVLPDHLHEILLMPEEVIHYFESGAFVCSVSGSPIHSVAHEMLVNKDINKRVCRSYNPLLPNTITSTKSAEKASAIGS